MFDGLVEAHQQASPAQQRLTFIRSLHCHGSKEFHRNLFE